MENAEAELCSVVYVNGGKIVFGKQFFGREMAGKAARNADDLHAGKRRVRRFVLEEDDFGKLAALGEFGQQGLDKDFGASSGCSEVVYHKQAGLHLRHLLFRSFLAAARTSSTEMERMHG